VSNVVVEQLSSVFPFAFIVFISLVHLLTVTGILHYYIMQSQLRYRIQLMQCWYTGEAISQTRNSWYPLA